MNLSATYSTGAKELFAEALTYYLHAMSSHHFLTDDDKDLILLAVHGLTKLGNYPLARALIRVSFSDLTLDEMLSILDEAHQVGRDRTLFIPF